MTEFSPDYFNIRQLYDRFDTPVTALDCGAKCAPYNPSGKPFCCDICQAVPAVYRVEWDYLRDHTDLWHVWRGDECPEEQNDPGDLLSETPDHMCLLACKGPRECQREYRAMSCRQFPFFPYLTSNGRFLGLAYYWEFEATCWVISHLGSVTETYRSEFIRVYDEILAQWDAEFESYAIFSEKMRDHFAAQRRRIPILHRNGVFYLINPVSERMQRVPFKEIT